MIEGAKGLLKEFNDNLATLTLSSKSTEDRTLKILYASMAEGITKCAVKLERLIKEWERKDDNVQ